MRKTPVREKTRPVYRLTQKTEKTEYKEPEVHEFNGIRYIVLGNLEYAVDEKGVIDYALTRILREDLEKR